METSYFKYGYKQGKEVNIKIGQYVVRIARFQIAFWKNEKTVFNLLF